AGRLVEQHRLDGRRSERRRRRERVVDLQCADPRARRREHDRRDELHLRGRLHGDAGLSAGRADPGRAVQQPAGHRRVVELHQRQRLPLRAVQQRLDADHRRQHLAAVLEHVGADLRHSGLVADRVVDLHLRRGGQRRAVLGERLQDAHRAGARVAGHAGHPHAERLQHRGRPEARRVLLRALAVRHQLDVLMAGLGRRQRHAGEPGDERQHAADLLALEHDPRHRRGGALDRAAERRTDDVHVLAGPLRKRDRTVGELRKLHVHERGHVPDDQPQHDHGDVRGAGRARRVGLQRLEQRLESVRLGRRQSDGLGGRRAGAVDVGLRRLLQARQRHVHAKRDRIAGHDGPDERDALALELQRRGEPSARRQPDELSGQCGRDGAQRHADRYDHAHLHAGRQLMRRMRALAALAVLALLPLPALAQQAPATGSARVSYKVLPYVKASVTPNYQSGFGPIGGLGSGSTPAVGSGAVLDGGTVDFGNVVVGYQYLYKYAAQVNVQTNDTSGFIVYAEGATDLNGSNPTPSPATYPLFQTLYWLVSNAANTAFSPATSFNSTTSGTPLG